MIQLNIVDLLEILLHVGLTKGFLIRLLRFVDEGHIDVVKVSPDQQAINLVGL
jgi:hypothetical protein